MDIVSHIGPSSLAKDLTEVRRALPLPASLHHAYVTRTLWATAQHQRERGREGERESE
jgi:hypothetical protein